MKKIILIAMVIISSAFGVSEYAGTSGMTFLKIDFSPRASALGDASVGYANGPDGLLSNPAAMSFERDLSVGTSFGSLYAGISSGYLVAQKGFSFGKLGLSTRFVSYGTMDRTDEQGNVVGDFGSTDLAISLLYSREIVDHLAIGFAPFSPPVPSTHSFRRRWDWILVRCSSFRGVAAMSASRSKILGASFRDMSKKRTPSRRR